MKNKKMMNTIKIMKMVRNLPKCVTTPPPLIFHLIYFFILV